MGNEAWSKIHQAVWKFRTQKFDDNIYFEFEEKFGALPRVHFIHIIYCFEAWEVMSPTLQTMCKLELKWRSYDHLNKPHKVEGSFQNDSKIQLMNSKSNSKLPQFWIHPLPLWCSHPLPQELLLRHFIYLKWAPLITTQKVLFYNL